MSESTAWRLWIGFCTVALVAMVFFWTWMGVQGANHHHTENLARIQACSRAAGDKPIDIARCIKESRGGNN
jgi:hypothetical protein